MQMRKWAEWLDEQSSGGADGTLPLLKPGDASMAAPFTIKSEDVIPVTDIIKQGRCTLVTTVQMFKILGLMCLSSAYSFSVLNLAGVKLGDLQVRVAPAFACPLLCRCQVSTKILTCPCIVQHGLCILPQRVFAMDVWSVKCTASLAVHATAITTRLPSAKHTAEILCQSPARVHLLPIDAADVHMMFLFSSLSYRCM
jgi:hypothetical protein